MWKKFWDNVSGATAIEYGLIIALIIVAIMGGMVALGDHTAKTFDAAASVEAPPTAE